MPHDDTAACHCGRLVYVHENLNGFTRGLCQECDTVRCDAPVEGESYPCRSANTAAPETALCWHCDGSGRLPHCEHDPITIPGENGPAWIECFLCGKRLETFDD